MNLWFRLLWMLCCRPWRRQTPADGTTVIRMRVWPFDLDWNRHVTNGRYFSLADVARLDFVFKSGAYRVAWRHRAFPIVGDNWGKFRKELKLFQTFEIHTRLLGWDDKWVFMEHRFMRRQRVVGVVIMRGLLRASKAVVHPQELVAELGLAPESGALPEWLKGWSNSCEALSEVLRQSEQR